MTGAPRDHRQICRAEDVVDLESRNGLLQFDEIRRLAHDAFAAGRFALTTSTIVSLHELATRGIYSDAGRFRTGEVTISGTAHVPPPASEVRAHVDDMVSYVNDSWDKRPLHLCAYLMWRCNWIHPFFDGNGRTTRALSYLVFLAKLGYEPGGTPTFVDMIASDRRPYYAALDDADAAWKMGALDVSSMETLVAELLTKQLAGLLSRVR
jgi:Fic family protein